ncbi:MAG: hypothetical protein ACT4ON_09185 [Bacteroidota bacterium]
MHKTLSIIAIILFTFKGFSQIGTDTILLLNGNIIITNIIDSTGGSVSFKNPKKPKKNTVIENDRIFSITDSTGENIIYTYDTIIGNEFTIEEMRYFIRGEQDAQKGFKAKGAFWGNLFVGAGAGITGFFFSPAAPFIFTALSGVPKVKIKKECVSDLECLNHDAYLMGYERVADKKRQLRSLVSGGIGLAAGLTTFFILKNNDAELLK